MKKYCSLIAVLIILIILILPKISEQNMNGENVSIKFTDDVKTTSVPKEVLIADNVKNENNFNEYHPIVFTIKNQEGIFDEAFLIGGSKDGKWYLRSDFELPENSIDKDYINIDLAKGGEEYRFYSQNKFITSSTGEKPTYFISQASGSGILEVRFDSFKANEKYLIGLNAKWDVFPIIPKFLDNHTCFVDLDSDGQEEILKVLKTKSNKGNNKDAKEIEFVIESKNNRIIVDNRLLDGIYAKEYIIFVLDLNGDGKMEIMSVLIGHNISLNVKQFNDGKISNVFGFYDGD